MDINNIRIIILQLVYYNNNNNSSGGCHAVAMQAIAACIWCACGFMSTQSIHLYTRPVFVYLSIAYHSM